MCIVDPIRNHLLCIGMSPNGQINRGTCIFQSNSAIYITFTALRSCCMQQEMWQRSSYPPISVQYQAPQKLSLTLPSLSPPTNYICSSQEVYRIAWNSSRCLVLIAHHFEANTPHPSLTFPHHTSTSPPVPHSLITTPMHVSTCTPSTPHMSNLIPATRLLMHTPTHTCTLTHRESLWWQP